MIIDNATITQVLRHTRITLAIKKIKKKTIFLFYYPYDTQFEIREVTSKNDFGSKSSSAFTFNQKIAVEMFNDI